jgi:hypothetical protein
MTPFDENCYKGKNINPVLIKELSIINDLSTNEIVFSIWGLRKKRKY